MLTPTKDQARQFALLLDSGMPSGEAIRYFLPPDEAVPAETIKALHDGWVKSSALRAAMLEVRGKEWQDLSLDERLQLAINKHYAELAYYLYSRNFTEAAGAELQKMNEARRVLEAKLAGLAGKSDPLTRFWEDVVSGKVKLPGAKVAPAALPA